jgi:hypothetical protein
MNLENALKHLIVQSVDSAIRQLFPDKYFSLCHVYAIVGSNVASIILNRNYRPVAGLSIIDCGAGSFIKMIDNHAFSSANGGAFHSWIESQPKDAGIKKELIDIPFKHNSAYARYHNLVWKKKDSSYLWGDFDKLVINAGLNDLPENFPEGKIWLQETPEGQDWMYRQVSDHLDEYCKITTLSLKLIKTYNTLVKIRQCH